MDMSLNTTTMESKFINRFFFYVFWYFYRFIVRKGKCLQVVESQKNTPKSEKNMYRILWCTLCVFLKIPNLIRYGYWLLDIHDALCRAFNFLILDSPLFSEQVNIVIICSQPPSLDRAIGLGDVQEISVDLFVFSFKSVCLFAIFNLACNFWLIQYVLVVSIHVMDVCWIKHIQMTPCWSLCNFNRYSWSPDDPHQERGVFVFAQRHIFFHKDSKTIL